MRGAAAAVVVAAVAFSLTACGDSGDSGGLPGLGAPHEPAGGRGAPGSPGAPASPASAAGMCEAGAPSSAGRRTVLLFSVMEPGIARGIVTEPACGEGPRGHETFRPAGHPRNWALADDARIRLLIGDDEDPLLIDATAEDLSRVLSECGSTGVAPDPFVCGVDSFEVTMTRNGETITSVTAIAENPVYAVAAPTQAASPRR